jgi:hypothetical protein
MSARLRLGGRNDDGEEIVTLPYPSLVNVFYFPEFLPSALTLRYNCLKIHFHTEIVVTYPK